MTVTTKPTETAPLTAPAAQRGERLYPRRSSRLYWHLTCLRRAVESLLNGELSAATQVKLIDYGSGNAPYKPLFAPICREYVACDFRGNEFADVLLRDDGTVPLDDASADMVLSSQVLEHVADPPLYLAEAARLLKENGLLVLSTHGVWKFHPDPNDYWRWTSQGLRREIERAGFEIVSFEGIMAPAAIGLQLYQDAVRHALPKLLRPPFTFVMQVLIELADRWSTSASRNKDASVFVVLARKA